MGGGDLNSKKSWHPNTMKNQERVWKAEQASAEEKKRILELQRERTQERDRAELNDLAKRTAGSSGADNRLHWMYDKPDKKVQHEDFLLGKAIDSKYETDKVEQDYIPAVARRVVGSSMLASAGDTQVDLARKMREDPLMLVKERERAARAALLNNPLQRRRLTELLRKEQDQRNERKVKKKPKKNEDLDNMLAAKLNALGEKQIDLAALLASKDSSSDSSSEEEQKKSKKKHKKFKKHKKEKKKSKSNDTDEESLGDDDTDRHKYKRDEKCSSPKHRSGAPKSSRRDDARYDSHNEQGVKKYKRGDQNESRSDIAHQRRSRRDSTERGRRCSPDRGRPPPERKSARAEERNSSQDPRPGGSGDRGRCNTKSGMSEEERAAKLAAMAAAGAERERERGVRVAGQRAAAAAAERAAPARARAAPHALPDSLESRIRSNRHYIQRDRSHMDRPFARR